MTEYSELFLLLNEKSLAKMDEMMSEPAVTLAKQMALEMFAYDDADLEY